MRIGKGTYGLICKGELTMSFFDLLLPVSLPAKKHGEIYREEKEQASRRVNVEAVVEEVEEYDLFKKGQ